jgi:hypothetical protein
MVHANGLLKGSVNLGNYRGFYRTISVIIVMSRWQPAKIEPIVDTQVPVLIGGSELGLDGFFDNSEGF